MSADKIGRDRFNSRSGEIKAFLVPCVRSGRTCLEFYRLFCDRFAVSASGADSEWGPVEAWLPEGRVRWDRVLAAIDYRDLRLVAHENPDFFASFAVCREELDGEDEQFDQFPDPANEIGYVPRLPDALIPPKSFRAVWTLTSDMHHGSDEKHGNVQLFRSHRVNDPLSGTASYVPFLAGNAARGLLRDMAFGRWLQLLGLKATDIPPFRAHSLFAGGSVDQGADGAKVNNVIRTAARNICPPWDLFAGCIEQQIMSGRARIGDAVLVCRENAWKTHEIVEPGIPVREWASMLPEACTMTKLRLETRQKHADIPESDGIQMLVNRELLVQGYQMVHTIQLWCMDGVNPVTAACLHDLLTDFRDCGTVGAGSAHGFGMIAFAPYVPGPGTSPLPDPDLYLKFIEEHKQEAIDWLMSPLTTVEERQRKEPKKKGSTRGGADVSL